MFNIWESEFQHAALEAILASYFGVSLVILAMGVFDAPGIFLAPFGAGGPHVHGVFFVVSSHVCGLL
jgi:uncharacterized membrane protein